MWPKVLTMEPLLIQWVQGLLPILFSVISKRFLHAVYKYIFWYFSCIWWLVLHLWHFCTSVRPFHFQLFLVQSPDPLCQLVSVANELFYPVVKISKTKSKHTQYISFWVVSNLFDRLMVICMVSAVFEHSSAHIFNNCFKAEKVNVLQYITNMHTINYPNQGCMRIYLHPFGHKVCGIKKKKWASSRTPCSPSLDNPTRNKWQGTHQIHKINNYKGMASFQSTLITTSKLPAKSILS